MISSRNHDLKSILGPGIPLYRHGTALEFNQHVSAKGRKHQRLTNILPVEFGLDGIYG